MKNYQNKEWLENQYVDQEKSIDALAQICNVDRKIIIQALNDFRIYRKYDHNKHPMRW
jgi:predicted transcriptional regulator